jgi:uncharacterized protein YdaU (DUF1376 family)
MKKKQNSAFELPWYYRQVPRDFMSSPDVEIMTCEEVGSYFLLLQKSWLSGDNCTLPNDPERLARLARVGKVSELVISKFEVDKEGRLFNPRLKEEWDNAVKRSKDASNAAKKSHTNGLRSQSGRTAVAEQSQSEGTATQYLIPNTQNPRPKTKKLKAVTTYTGVSESANAVSSSAAPSTPTAPSEDAVKLVQKLVGILGRSDHKPGTLAKFAAEVQPLVTKHGMQTVTDVMDFALVNNRDGFWRGRVYAMCNFVKCFNSMHKQMKRGTGNSAAADPLAARAASLKTGADFSHLEKGDL